jgi:hypothetical protein
MGKPELVHNLIWLLTHLSDSERNRNIVLYSKMFTIVLDFLENPSLNMLVLRHGIWLIATVSVGYDGEMTDNILVKLFNFSLKEF